jgi:hypothetical protein
VAGDEQTKSEASVARTYSLGPGFFRYGQPRAVDLQNRSALRSMVTAALRPHFGEVNSPLRGPCGERGSLPCREPLYSRIENAGGIVVYSDSGGVRGSGIGIREKPFKKQGIARGARSR